MAFEVKRDGQEKVNQNVLLEVQLPDNDSIQKYSIKRLSNGKLAGIQVRGKKEKATNNEIGFNVVGEVVSNITPLEGSMDFADLTDLINEISSDDTVAQLTDYVMKLATADVNELKREGISVW